MAVLLFQKRAGRRWLSQLELPLKAPRYHRQLLERQQKLGLRQQKHITAAYTCDLITVLPIHGADGDHSREAYVMPVARVLQHLRDLQNP
jgi:hypothetical protein